MPTNNMKISQLTPYVWNLLWQTFIPTGGSTQVVSATAIRARHDAEAWLTNHTTFEILDRLLTHEGIIGYTNHIINLVNDLDIKPTQR